MAECTCGRTFTHCRVCGSRNVYPLKFRSLEKSQEIGRPITIYGCRGKCGQRTDDMTVCKAPPYNLSTDYTPETPREPTPVELPPEPEPFTGEQMVSPMTLDDIFEQIKENAEKTGVIDKKKG